MESSGTRAEMTCADVSGRYAPIQLEGPLFN